jgi:hypothetical protein
MNEVAPALVAEMPASAKVTFAPAEMLLFDATGCLQGPSTPDDTKGQRLRRALEGFGSRDFSTGAVGVMCGMTKQNISISAPYGAIAVDLGR